MCFQVDIVLHMYKVCFNENLPPYYRSVIYLNWISMSSFILFSTFILLLLSDISKMYFVAQL